MFADDFIFDGQRASDYGLVICNIDSYVDSVVSVGADLNLNPVSVRNGSRQYITDTTYDSVASVNFQVAKLSCGQDNESTLLDLSLNECREIIRWLMQKEYKLFHPISEFDEFDEVWYEGTFTSVQEVVYDGKVIGFELAFTSNRPFAIGNLMTYTFTADNAVESNGEYSWTFRDMSDEVGYIYPKKLIITMKEASGSTEASALSIYNDVEERTTKLWNLSSGEVITCDENLNISTSIDGHKLANDFNYVFFRIANTYNNRVNNITANYKCDIEFQYYPIIKGAGI